MNFPYFSGQTRWWTEDISPRGISGVYVISDKHVAKALPNFELYDPEHPCPEDILEAFQRRVQRELSITQTLYENGISVPKPEGIFNVRLRNDKSLSTSLFGRTAPAFVMERIFGTRRGILRGEDYRRASDQFDVEIQKAQDLGFIPGDHKSEGNSLWDLRRQRIVLIDFEQWRREE